MISPETPPGTEVVCVEAGPGRYGDGGLRRGAIYTVERIAPAIDGGHVVVLTEIPPWQTYTPPWGLVGIGFELRRFRYLDLPASLTALLEESPVELESEGEEA
ncbi:hypothetical protein [Methylocystis echinoides]|uniref:Uncharacterized protein n=1 Tax=Methylocystis echinoides TaxID=29468 RepID=A0A9W6GVI5_9HYPH|nr:hypothetical protein [Methylocystis echinoides]GLI93706.1 hypothetical protein LMG27198_26980 [Methylocystis echinoides]